MKKTLENYTNLKKEFNFKRNKNLSPRDFTSGSQKKIWWICSRGHEWKAIVGSRTSRRTGCPFCGGQKVSQDNNLKFLHPKIAKEWHPTKNGNKKPSEFTSGSQKKVWWKCAHGHEWESVISNRTKGRGCKKCFYIKKPIKRNN